MLAPHNYSKDGVFLNTTHKENSCFFLVKS